MRDQTSSVAELQKWLFNTGLVSRATRSPLTRTGSLVASRYGWRDYYLRRLLAISDVACLFSALLLAMALVGGSPGHPWSEYLLFGIPTLPIWVVLFKMYGLYERDAKRLSHSTLDDLPSLFHALLLGCVLLWCWFVIAAPAKLVFGTVLIFGALALTLVLTGRALTRTGFLRLIGCERVLLIGTGRSSGVLIEKIQAKRSLRLEPVGMVSCERDREQIVKLPVLGYLDEVDLPSMIAERGIMRVVVADSEVQGERLLQLLHDCRATATKVSLLPATFSVLGPAVEVDDVQGVTVLGINPPVLSRSSRWVKRGLDIVGAGTALILLSPLIVLLGALVRLDSSGPALFRQKRIGRGGRQFRLLKLRTMVNDAEPRRVDLVSQSKEPGWLHLEHDPRVTRVGRVLRITSLDELPQLWNVLRGDMSLVGPRPLIPEEDSMVDDWARARLDLMPGITGLWQVLGRTSIPFEEMVKLDYLYVTNWSLWGDLRLILRTLPVVLRRHGAN